MPRQIPLHDNLFVFNVGDILGDIYTDTHYQLLRLDKKGMAEILNLNLNRVEGWNAYNNCRFYKLKGKLNLFNER